MSGARRLVTLPDHAARYLRQSGVITWDRDALSSCRLDEELCRLLDAAALLEEDTAISARQARSFGLDRSPDVAAFLRSWELEEAEHGRALRFLLAHQTYRPPARPRTTAPARRRGVARVPATWLRHAPQTGLLFCALGAAAEYVATVTYTELAKEIDEPVVVSLLRAIIRQEGRHLGFFLSAARARSGAMSAVNGALARRAFRSVWEPIGVPSLGRPAWDALFARWLDDDRFLARVEVMDRVVDTIPHLAGMHLMETFLREAAVEMDSQPVSRSR